MKETNNCYVYAVMDVLITLIIVIISQCICISKHGIVHQNMPDSVNYIQFFKNHSAACYAILNLLPSQQQPDHFWGTSSNREKQAMTPCCQGSQSISVKGKKLIVSKERLASTVFSKTKMSRILNKTPKKVSRYFKPEKNRKVEGYNQGFLNPFLHVSS